MEGVSIHAPWEGCDGLQIDSTKRPSRFNSRTLGRVRQAGNAAINAYMQFQFTHPGKGATQAGNAAINAYMQFQFTHPGKGATTPRLRGS